MDIAREVGDGTILARALRGSLGEDFDQALLDPRGARILMVDLSLVSRVSSYGVREWANGAAAARARANVYFVHASPRMTDQFNMIAGFDGGGTLLTFYGNYLCGECDEDTPVLFDLLLDNALFTRGEAPSRACRCCGRQAQLDDIPEAIFEYARGRPTPTIPEELDRFLASSSCWLEVRPGRRARLLRVQTQRGGVVFRVTGVLDETFNGTRLLATPPENFVLDLSRVTDLTQSGVALWGDFIGKLSQRANLRLEGVPPVVLRRAAENPEVLGSVPVSSVLLRGRCQSCRNLVALSAPANTLNAPDAITRHPCPSCKAMALRALCTPEDLRAFRAVMVDAPELARRSSARIVVPPPPVAPAPTTHSVTSSVANLPAFLSGVSTVRYEPVCKIGEGGMSAVYLVRQHGAVGFRRLVVVKLMRPEFMIDDRLVRMFLDEARLAARLDHPNIVRIHDLGRSSGVFFIVMDFVHGRSVAEMIARAGKDGAKWPPALAALITAEVAAALSRAHVPRADGRVCVHRDVAPNNVMLQFDGRVKLIDFGLTGHWNVNKKDETRDDHLVGNLMYMAPELLEGREPTPQSDIWGAGLVLLAMLLRKHPFRMPTIQDTVVAILHKEAPIDDEDVPGPLRKVLRRCLKKDQAARYQSAAELEVALREAALELTTAPSALVRFFRGSQPPRLDQPGQYLARLFSHQVRVENEFVRRSKAPTLHDALLDAEVAEVARLFRLLRGQEASGESGRDGPRDGDEAVSDIDSA